MLPDTPRSWNDLPEKERDTLLNLKAEKRLTNEVFTALNLRMTRDSLRRKLNEHKTVYAIRQQTVRMVTMPPSPSKRYTDFAVLEGDDYIIISDIELPDYNPLYLERAILAGMAHGIRKLIIAGDFLATDQDALNEWVSLWQTEDMTYEEAINLAKSVLTRLLSWFTTIDIIEGNHDDRPARKTGGQIHLGMFIAAENVRYSRYHFLWVKTSKGYVYVCHPRQYSANSVGLGQKIYNTLTAPDGSKPMGIVVAHTHQAQVGTTPDGHGEVIALGTCRDKDLTKYKATSANTHHEWENGFLMIRKAYFYPLTSRSDWRFWLGEYYPDDTPAIAIE